jgi:hypothetical protein
MSGVTAVWAMKERRTLCAEAPAESSAGMATSVARPMAMSPIAS